MKTFFLIVTDKDTMKFNVFGPIADDEKWNKRVCDAQASGRAVNCHAAGPSKNMTEVIERYEATYEYEYSKEPIL